MKHADSLSAIRRNLPIHGALKAKWGFERSFSCYASQFILFTSSVLMVLASPAGFVPFLLRASVA